jgi:hypothetical protein
VSDDDLTLIRSRVPDYAGVDDPAARRASDRHLRAWAGEALAGLRDQIPAGVARDRLDAAVLACEFADQRLVMAFEEHAALDEPAALVRYLAADRAVVEALDALLAAREPDARVPALDAVEAALRARIRTAGVDAG